MYGPTKINTHDFILKYPNLLRNLNMRYPLIIILILLFHVRCTPTNTEMHGHASKKTIQYSQTLEILETGESVRVHIHHPENQTIQRYLLAKKKPAKMPHAYTFIQIPIASIAVMSGTHVGMLSKLESIPIITGISDKKYIFNQTLRKRLNTGHVSSMGSEENTNFEKLLLLRPSVLMYSGFSKEFPRAHQLKRAGIACIANFDWKENHPLGRAEWLKLFGYLVGKEKEAIAYFKEIEKSYVAIQQNATKYKEKPTVLSGNLIGDLWYAPAGKSYFAQLFTDANTSYVYAAGKGQGSLALTIEQVIASHRSASFWFNPGFSTIKSIQKNTPKANYLEALKKNNTYCYSHNSNKFWELSAIEPHHLLSDIVQVSHPSKANKKTLYFYKKVTHEMEK